MLIFIKYISNFIFMPNPIIEEPDDRVVVYQPPPPRQPREPWYKRLIGWITDSSYTPPKRPALPAPPVVPISDNQAMVIYTPPRYSTRKLTRYGNNYIGATLLNKESFEKFRGSGRGDPILF